MAVLGTSLSEDEKDARCFNNAGFVGEVAQRVGGVALILREDWNLYGNFSSGRTERKRIDADEAARKTQLERIIAKEGRA